MLKITKWPHNYGGPKVSSRRQNFVLAKKSRTRKNNLVLTKKNSYSQKKSHTRKKKSCPCGEKSRLCTGHQISPRDFLRSSRLGALRIDLMFWIIARGVRGWDQDLEFRLYLCISKQALVLQAKKAGSNHYFMI